MRDVSPLLRRFAVSLLSGFVAGVAILGVGGRIAMRIMAVVAHREAHFSLGATLGILLIGGILGTLASIPFAAVRRWLPRNPVSAGVIYGTAMLMILIPLQPASIRDEITALRGFLLPATLIFWIVCTSYAIALARLNARMAPEIGRASCRERV